MIDVKRFAFSWGSAALLVFGIGYVGAMAQQQKTDKKSNGSIY